MSFYAVAKKHNIQSLIDARAADTPSKIFFISPEDGKTVDYQSLQTTLQAAGKHFIGTQQGDTIAALVGNGWAAVQLLLAIPYHGRRVLMLNPAAGRTGLAYAIRHSDCKLIFTDEESAGELHDIAKAENLTSRIKTIQRTKEIASSEKIAPPPLSANDDGLLIYTSGTTGQPKGVLHTHTSLLYGGAITATAHQLTAADRGLCVLPLCHINAQCVSIMATLVSGGGVAVAAKFSASNFWQWLSDTSCTWFSIVPTIVSHLVHASGERLPTPHLRFGRSASAALPPETHQQFERRFNIKLIETMGLSETAATILSNPMPPSTSKYGSPGIAIGNEVKILNPTTHAPQSPNTEGEIAVRGANVMHGYLNNPTETAATFTADGWLLTGDLGRMDDDGFVFVTGRRKELIIKGGENISPREIDDALYQIQGVVEAAAFARKCQTYGQRVEAAVVLADNAATSENDILQQCRQSIGEFKTPDKIYFLDDLPKGPSGKIQRLKILDLIGNRA